MYSLITGSLRETVNRVIYHKIPSPNNSGKPMPVENHFFLVVVERIPTLREKLLTAARKRV
jgi:hypothetical protein